MASTLLSFLYLVPVGMKAETLADVPDYIGKAIPFFLLLIVLEIFYGKARGVKLYAFKDTVMSISLGILQQVLGIWIKEIAIVPYIATFNFAMPYRTMALDYVKTIIPDHFDTFYSVINSELFLFCAGIFGCDLGYYFFHRFAHEYHMLWVSHSVHHSGERYNFATALRQGSTQSLFSWVLYLPLAVLGLPAVHYVRHSRLNTLFQFWIHTEAIGVLWWPIEAIFNTPSHHRMHHRPPGNCNYAGVFIIYDRIFGTFDSEIKSIDNDIMGRSANYGLAQPLDSFRPIYANLKHLWKLWCIAPNGLVNKINYLLTMLFTNKKRAGHKMTVIWNWKELFPEFIGNVSGRRSLFSMPDCLRLESNDNKQLREKYSKDFSFVVSRNDRESPSLALWQRAITILLFVLSLVGALGLLVPLPRDGALSLLVPTDKALWSLMVVMALEVIPMVYAIGKGKRSSNKEK